MKTILTLFALVAILLDGALYAQYSPEEAVFMERWQRLQNDFDAGRLELNAQGLPVEHDTQTSKASEQGLFNVTINSQRQPLPFNQLHDWSVRVITPDGEPVIGAELQFFGGMPLHNHGFPTVPKVTGEPEPGTYALEGIKFSMSGWWQLAFGIAAGEKKDIVSFNLVLEP
ncbi:MAG: FixH family protein [Gammaproteobacteria bacterium]